MQEIKLVNECKASLMSYWEKNWVIFEENRKKKIREAFKLFPSDHNKRGKYIKEHIPHE